MILAKSLIALLSSRRVAGWVVAVACLVAGGAAVGGEMVGPFGPQSESPAVPVTPTTDGTPDWERELVVQRIRTVVVGCGLVLVLIVIAFGYFRLDHATRGIYSRRLLVFALLLSLLALLSAAISLTQIWR